MKNEKVPLKEVASYIKRGVTPKYVNDEGICVLNQKCIRNGRVSFEQSRLTDTNTRINEEKILKNGDILINSTGTGTLGRTAQFYYTNGIEKAIVDTHITILRPDINTVSPRYLAYVLRKNEPAIVKMAKGATNQVELSSQDLGALPVKLRSRVEQDRIASILSSYDDLIENNRRRIKLLEEAARQLYKEWFVRFRFPGHEKVKIINGVPEGWEKKRIGMLSSFLSRGMTPKYDKNGKYKVINQKCIRNRLLTLDLVRLQSKEFSEEKLVCYGDVFINSTGTGTLGRVAQCWLKLKNYTVDTHVTIVRPNNEINKFWFGYSLMELESRFEDMGEGATNQKELKRRLVADIELLLPSQSLTKKFDEIIEGTTRQIVLLIEQNQNLLKVRDLLLPKLMSGEIAV
jgi:type I restriction enzyme, S subunit